MTTSRIGAALREKFRTPQAAIKALGLDENLLSTENNTMKPTRLANAALQMTAAFIKPMLAKDAKVDLMPIFAGVTTKNFKPAEIKLALDAALKGQLAQDADPHMGHVAQMLDHLGSASDPKTADESVSEPQHKAMEAAAHGESTLGIPERVGKEFVSKDGVEGLKGFLKEKGMADDDIMKACDMFPKAAMDADESDEDKKKREADEKKAADEKMEADKKAAADRAAKDAEMDDMVKKPAMDAAIAAATTATEKRVIERQRAIRKAEGEVRPYVGELSTDLVFDSADDVYRHALGMLGVKEAKDIHASALPTILKLQPLAGAKPVQRATPSLGMDAAASTRINEMYPGMAAIGDA